MDKIQEVIDSIPSDQLKAIVSFLLMIPFGWVANTLFKDRLIRLWVFLIIGLALQFNIYREAMLHVLVACTVNIVILKTVPRKRVGRVAATYNHLHNSVIHLHRLFFEDDNWRIEISVIFMMTMCKWAGFAYAYQDAENEEKLSKDQKKNMIKEFTVLEYFSYTFFYPSSMCGPFFEFSDYLRYINLSDEYANIPSTVMPSLTRFLQGIVYIAIYNAAKPFIAPEMIIDENNLYSFKQKIMFYLLSNTHHFKYIAGFAIAESSIIASGFAYSGEAKNGDDKNHDIWERGRAISIIDLHLVYDPEDFFRFWNISIHKYLKRYVYFRITPKNPSFAQKQIASSATFIISGFWHGFHPTYMITFLHFYLFTLISNNIKSFGKKINAGPTLRNVTAFICRLYVFFILVPYHCLMFISLDYVKLIKFFITVKAFASVHVIFANILFFVLNVVIKSPKKQTSNPNSTGSTPKGTVDNKEE